LARPGGLGCSSLARSASAVWRSADRLHLCEAWLLTLRQRLAEVEADTDEARRQRRELVELLVEKIIVAENGDGGATVVITYRFGPPAREQGEPSEEISHGQRNSNVFPA
jgi:hypothetical protein